MLLIADTGAIISLILVKEFNILEKLFPNYIGTYKAQRN